MLIAAHSCCLGLSASESLGGMPCMCPRIACRPRSQPGTTASREDGCGCWKGGQPASQASKHQSSTAVQNMLLAALLRGGLLVSPALATGQAAASCAEQRGSSPAGSALRQSRRKHGPRSRRLGTGGTGRASCRCTHRRIGPRHRQPCRQCTCQRRSAPGQQRSQCTCMEREWAPAIVRLLL